MAYEPNNPNGQTTMANSSPVVIASNQSAVAVSNAGLTALNGAITGTEVQVDIVAPLPAGTNNIGDVDVLTLPVAFDAGATSATTQRIITATNSPDVTALQLLDDTVATLGTTTYTEATTKANVIGAVRRDANTTLVDTTNEIAPLQVNATGELKVAQIAALPTGSNTIGAVNIAASQTLATVTTVSTVTNITNQGMGADDSAFTVGTTRVMTAGFLADETATDSVDEGDMGAARMTLNRRQVMAGNVLDDAEFGIGTEYTNPASFLADETATDSVDEGDAGIARMTLDRKQIVTPYAHTAGGATPYKLNSAATTNATNVKGSAGQVYSIMCTNTNAAVRYLKLYNKATAPTVGTDTPVQVYAIPGATTGGGFTLSIPVGMVFSLGIGFATTTGAADADTGVVAANEIIVNLTFN